MTRKVDEPNRDRRAAHVTFASLAALVLLGCGDAPQIRVQDVPKQPIERDEFPGLNDPTHGLLAALVPQDQNVWVFRLDGPRDRLEVHRDAFVELIESVQLTEGAAKPEWSLPAGWDEVASETSSPRSAPLRAATIRVPDEEADDLEVSVMQLPMRQDWLHYRVENVNRWRRQLQLPVAGATEMARASQSVHIAEPSGVEASLIYLTGQFTDDQISQMGRSPAGAAHPTVQQPADPPQQSASSTELSYETPPGWAPGPTSQVRRASFAIRENGEQASVAVTRFSTNAGPQMASPVANINRWRGQVGLSPLSADQLTETMERVSVGGSDGVYVSLDGEGDTAGRAIRAAMVVRSDGIWFFKMDGPQELVQQETENFRKFLDSVSFSDQVE